MSENSTTEHQKATETEIRKGAWSKIEIVLCSEAVTFILKRQNRFEQFQTSKELPTRFSWTEVAKIVQTRDAKQCREKYINHLSPSLNHSDWTVAEDHLLIELSKRFGTSWSKFRHHFKGRSLNMIKLRYRFLCRNEDRLSHRTLNIAKRTLKSRLAMKKNQSQPGSQPFAQNGAIQQPSSLKALSRAVALQSESSSENHLKRKFTQDINGVNGDNNNLRNGNGSGRGVESGLRARGGSMNTSKKFLVSESFIEQYRLFSEKQTLKCLSWGKNDWIDIDLLFQQNKKLIKRVFIEYSVAP